MTQITAKGPGTELAASSGLAAVTEASGLWLPTGPWSGLGLLSLGTWASRPRPPPGEGLTLC